MANIPIFLIIAISVLYANAGVITQLSKNAVEYREFLKQSVNGKPTCKGFNLSIYIQRNTYIYIF